MKNRRAKTIRDLMKQTVGFNPFPRKISQAEIDSHFKEENTLFKTKVAAGDI